MKNTEHTTEGKKQKLRRELHRHFTYHRGELILNLTEVRSHKKFESDRRRELHRRFTFHRGEKNLKLTGISRGTAGGKT